MNSERLFGGSQTVTNALAATRATNRKKGMISRKRKGIAPTVPEYVVKKMSAEQHARADEWRTADKTTMSPTRHQQADAAAKARRQADADAWMAKVKNRKK